jgi:hypothetical protein
MKRWAWSVWTAVGLVGVLLGGCSATGAEGGGGGGGGGGRGGGGSAGGNGAACEDSITKYCERMQACAPGLFPLSGYTSIADCVSFFLPPCQDALAAPHTGATPALVQQCGDGVAAMSCTDFLQRVAVPACLPQGGTTPIGGSCNNDWQCASGRCWVPSPDTCGSCAPTATF